MWWMVAALDIFLDVLFNQYDPLNNGFIKLFNFAIISFTHCDKKKGNQGSKGVRNFFYSCNAPVAVTLQFNWGQ